MADTTQVADPKVNPAVLSHATAVLAPLPAGVEPPTRTRWSLHIEAQTWRYLMDIGMILHKLCAPRPAGPNFYRKAPSTVSTSKGNIELVFYNPKGYSQDRDKAKRQAYPVVVNFHGGGFTIGRATDDVRWARAVNEQLDAVVVSVSYRLAPEYPFPTGVEDGADAIMYLRDHAQELNLDRNKIGVSGFSAGGNMAFSVPLRLYAELKRRREDLDAEVQGLSLPEGKLAFVCAWYPSTDFTLPRSERRKTNTKPEMELPKFFTNLFDASYLYPSSDFSLDSPYLSPGVAPAGMLKNALPDDIIMYTCEWDELHAEGERFHRRLVAEIGKKVKYTEIKGVPHGFDKSPNPLWQDPMVAELYKDACDAIGRILNAE